MRYHIPCHLWIDAPTPEHAAAAKQVLERLLTQDPMVAPMVQSMITSQLQTIGVQNLGPAIGEAKPEAQAAAGGKRR